ncbi:unnamed protein product, partial [Rotaria magnacalcarata]
MRQYIIDKHSKSSISLAEYPFIDDDPNLSHLGIHMFTWNDCIEMFMSDAFHRTHSIERNKQMITYFYSRCSMSEKIVGSTMSITRIPFLMDQNNRLQVIEDTYFPTDTIGDSGGMGCDESFLNKSIFNWLNEYQNHQIKQWLRKLGVTERTDLTFLHKTIIPNAAAHINQANAIDTIMKLFALFQKGTIGKEELSQLNTLKLLTTHGTLIPAERCYFSNSYDPRLPLEEYLKTVEDMFLSPNYLRNSIFCTGKEDLDEKRRFFSFMGVRENLFLIKCDTILATDKALQYGFCSNYLLTYSPNGRRMANAYSGLRTISFLQHTI